MDEFCVNNSVDNSISINLDDSKFSELIKIYKNMKTTYINNCEQLLNTLEKNILDTQQNSEDSKGTSSRYNLKNLSYTDLAEQETNVRNIITNMYADCHEQYQQGIVSLFNAFKTQETS